MTDELVDDLIAPAANPDVGKPADPSFGRPKAPETKHYTPGADLVPDFDKLGTVAVLRQYRYWVGVTPSCPVEGIDLAGINFPKVNEKLVDDPLRTGRRMRVPVIGAVVWLTEDKIKRMRERLHRTIIRFLRDDGEVEEPNTGKNVGDVHRRPRRGQLITIPTDAEVEARKKRGKATREYVPHKNDVPAARFMFACLCENQEQGSRGESYPDPLELTGLSWPEEINEEEVAELFS